jgi:hypothetical protein
VVDEESGRLVSAATQFGFQRLHRASRVVTGFPAPHGWTLRIWEDPKDNGSAFDVPIVGWLVDEDGDLIPVGHSSDRYLSPAGNQRSEVIPPQ